MALRISMRESSSSGLAGEVMLAAAAVSSCCKLQDLRTKRGGTAGGGVDLDPNPKVLDVKITP